MKVLALAYHTGSGNAVAASGKALMERGDEVYFVAQDDMQAGVAFGNYGLDYKLLDDFNGKDLFERLKNSYESFSPDVVLVGSSIPVKEREFLVEQQAVLLPKSRVVAILDFYSNYSLRFSDKGTKNLRYLPNAIMAIDDLCVKEMIEEGIPSELIVKTGNPHFEILNGRRTSSRYLKELTETRNFLNVSENDLLFLYGSSYLRRAFVGDVQCPWRDDVKEYAEYLRKLEENCRNILGYTEHDALMELVNWVNNDSNARSFSGRNVKIFLSPHPREVKEGDIPNLLTIRGDASITFIGHTKELISNQLLKVDRILGSADLYAGMISTTLYESLLENPRRPVISIQPNAVNRYKSDLAVPVRNGLVVPVYEKGKLRETFEKVMNEDPNEREKKVLRTLNLDGKSGERVADLVHKIAGS